MIYGTSAKNLGNFQVKDIPCPYCEHIEPQNMSIFGRYAHLVWIPFFPVGKVAVAECTRCKRTYDKSEFPAKLKAASDTLKKEVGTPKWFWAGLMIMGASFLFNIVSDALHVPDPREAMLNETITAMSTDPPQRFDSTSYMMDQLMTMMVVDEMRPNSFSYITKMDGDKALVLVNIPELDMLEKSVRPEVLEMVKTVTGNVESLKDKNIYYGILGNGTMMMTETPTSSFVNKAKASRAPIYAFYGSREEFEPAED